MIARTPHLSLSWLISAALVALSPLCAGAARPEPPPTTRPRIGLVLSGGGARGAAHIGVLKVLEQHRVPIDCIAGTSMGALVGGLYASGMSPAELERLISEMDWMKSFADKIPREDRSFRRKRDDDIYLVKNKPGLRGGKLLFPPGILDGHRIDLLLKRYTLPVVTVRDFDDLSIPFRAVAADIVTGEAVVCERGDLALAMRASMSIPAAFAPREIGDRLLVDGGITNNLPIDVARQMGADIIIAVDIGTPPSGRERLTSVMAITGQLMTVVSEQNRQKQIASLTDRDVFIKPDLGPITVASFDRAVRAIPIGYRAAQAAAEGLDRLSVSPQEYEAYLARRARRGPLPTVDRMRLVNRSRLGDDVIAARLDVETGKPLDVDRLEEALDQVFGLELFQSVYYDVVTERDSTVMTITARERAWGPNYLQGGIAAFEDFERPNFNIAVAYSRTAMNRLSGEWRTGLQVGQEPGAFTEFHQPLDRRLRKFAQLRLSAGEQTLGVFDHEGHKRSELGITRYGVELAGGRELGTWGEFRAGIAREGGRISTLVGDPEEPSRKFDTGEAFLQFHVDRLDEVSFPRAGGSFRVRLTAGRDALGSTTNYEQGLMEGCIARTRGRYTALLDGMFATTRDGDAPTQSLFRLGGLGQISGLQQYEIAGPHAALATATFYRRMTELEVMPVFAGFSVEYGNVFQSLSGLGFDDGIAATSVFVGLDTFLGPLHLAYAVAESGRQNYYLTLGQSANRRRAGFWNR